MSKSYKEVQIIRNNIIGTRKNLGMTQAEFANLLNVSQSTVTRWEKGNRLPSPSTMTVIARLANVTANDFSKRIIQHTLDEVDDYRDKQVEIVNKLNSLTHQLDSARSSQLDDTKLLSQLNKSNHGQLRLIAEYLYEVQNSGDSVKQLKAIDEAHNFIQSLKNILSNK